MTADAASGGAAEVAQIAQNLARNCNFAVSPCKEGKMPATPHGFKDATNDPEAVAELWRRFPGPLIGVATGEVSGVAVLDLDAKHDAARAWWSQNRQRMPATRRYRTRSGGMHLYFRHRPGVACSGGKITLGVDTRGDGGYVIHWFAAGLPCLDHSPPAPWPQWLFDMLHPPAPMRVPYDKPMAGDGSAAIEALIRTVRAAAEGERNGKLFWAAKKMRERGIDRAEADRELFDAASACGLPAVEVQRTIASAWRAA